MDNFKVIYSILKYIEACMDYAEFDEEHFTAKHFGVSEDRFYFLLKTLVDDGYIKGIKCESIKTGNYYVLILPQLTLAGMEYLEDNTMMKKAYRALKGIKNITPGI